MTSKTGRHAVTEGSRVMIIKPAQGTADPTKYVHLNKCGLAFQPKEGNNANNGGWWHVRLESSSEVVKLRRGALVVCNKGEEDQCRADVSKLKEKWEKKQVEKQAKKQGKKQVKDQPKKPGRKLKKRKRPSSSPWSSSSWSSSSSSSSSSAAVAAGASSSLSWPASWNQLWSDSEGEVNIRQQALQAACLFELLAELASLSPLPHQHLSVAKRKSSANNSNGRDSRLAPATRSSAAGSAPSSPAVEEPVEDNLVAQNQSSGEESLSTDKTQPSDGFAVPQAQSQPTQTKRTQKSHLSGFATAMRSRKNKRKSRPNDSESNDAKRQRTFELGSQPSSSSQQGQLSSMSQQGQLQGQLSSMTQQGPLSKLREAPASSSLDRPGCISPMSDSASSVSSSSSSTSSTPMGVGPSAPRWSGSPMNVLWLPTGHAAKTFGVNGNPSNAPDESTGTTSARK
eukprot:TRINITY_DN66623_c7_g14_i1.p1 TRINITY_DN66623_c7_g14~~TRINITY_DN66623_c7_g14_i1.p1  ORF type:complete len:454 (-),score=203.48 TRINITY_DN66623_c7_g14_i1:208-1569(-)